MMRLIRQFEGLYHNHVTQDTLNLYRLSGCSKRNPFGMEAGESRTPPETMLEWVEDVFRKISTV